MGWYLNIDIELLYQIAIHLFLILLFGGVPLLIVFSLFMKKKFDWKKAYILFVFIVCLFIAWPAAIGMLFLYCVYCVFIRDLIKKD